MKHLRLVWISLMLAAVGQANLLTNGSFEKTRGAFVADVNNVDALASGSTSIPGWTTVNGVDTAWVENGDPWNISAQDGSFLVDFTAYGNVGPYGGVAQTFATTAGTNYVVTFYLGYGGQGRNGISSSFAGPVSVDVSAAGVSQTFTSRSGAPNSAVWDLETFDFTAASSTTTLSIVGKSTTGGNFIGLDNVDVESAVPEPGSIGLLCAGLVLREGWLSGAAAGQAPLEIRVNCRGDGADSTNSAFS